MTKSILVVDDAKNLRTMVSAYLEQEGFQVFTAANGRDGLATARAGRSRPDYPGFDDAGDGRLRFPA